MRNFKALLPVEAGRRVNTRSGEIEAAAAFYQGRREGLGAEFTERVADALHRIELAPQGYEKIYRDLRRCTLHRFNDYALWYSVLPDSSIVVACLSSRRHPSPAWRRASRVQRTLPSET